MVDSDKIKDLKFPTLEFTNDSSGKLLLNIMFAMSKQYSEHLSESVQRGVDSNLAQGKSGDIIRFWREHDVHRMTKLTRRNKNVRKATIYGSESPISTILNDPFYRLLPLKPKKTKYSFRFANLSNVAFAEIICT